MMKISILGSTGSIGTQTLEVVDEQRDIKVVAMSCGSNLKLLEKQIRKYHPKDGTLITACAVVLFFIFLICVMSEVIAIKLIKRIPVVKTMVGM